MKEIVKYHNNFAEAIYSLDVIAKKILLAVILHKNDGNKIAIHRSAFKELVGIDPSKSDKSTQKAIEDLMTTIITIRDIKNPKNWEKYQLLKATKYKDGVLYTGMTAHLKDRIENHKTKKYANSFSARYNLDKLVYFEEFDDIRNAYKREKQIKAGSRKKKIELIESFNPDWKDLFDEIC